MDSNQENKDRTIRLRLTNNQEVDMDYMLEPEGMWFFIPPKSTHEIVIEQKEEDIEIVFSGPNEFSVYTNDLPAVMQNGVWIHPQSIEEIFAGFKSVGHDTLSSLAKEKSIKDITLTHNQRRILLDYMTVFRNLGVDKFKERANEVNLLNEEIAVLDALVKQKAYILKPSDPAI